MRRVEPPPGFAARVMDRVAVDRARPAAHRTPWRAVAAAMVMTAILGGWAAREASLSRRAAGERARDEVLVALRITSEKLRTAQEHVKQINTNDE
jgi:hypothetical protein